MVPRRTVTIAEKVKTAWQVMLIAVAVAGAGWAGASYMSGFARAAGVAELRMRTAAVEMDQDYIGDTLVKIEKRLAHIEHLLKGCNP